MNIFKAFVFSFFFLVFLFCFCFARAESLEISENTTWSDDKTIDDVVMVSALAKLTIKPGIKIEFKKGGNLRILGSLAVEGEEDSPVVFFREKPKLGEARWAYYVSFYPTSKSVLKNLNIREGGGSFEGGGRTPALQVKGDLEIYDSLITDNTWPLEVLGNGRLKMRDCDIYGNYQTWGVKVVDSTASADVAYNYWGDDSGPLHTALNKLGKGELIMGPNIEFSFWKQRGKKPIILVPGFGESLNFQRLFAGETGGNWWLFPPGKAMSALKDIFINSGWEENKNLFIGFYDWRKSFQESAKEDLRPVIVQAKKQTGFKEVDIIAFSFGGLVLRSYVQGEDYNFDVNNLITLGTPHKGVSKIYTFAEGGVIPNDWNPLLNIYLWLEQKVKDKTSLEYIRDYLPAVYEIIPTFDFLRKVSTQEFINSSSLIFANTALENLNNKIDLLENRVSAHFIGGAGQPTMDEISVSPHLNIHGSSWPDGIPDPFVPSPNSDQGDKTVLIKSSIWETEGIKTDLIESEHTDLPRKSKQKIAEILDIDLKDASSSQDSWDSYVIFAFASPISVEITNKEGKKISKDTNEIESAYYFSQNDLGKKIILIYDPEEEYTVNILGLENGNYRILVLNRGKQGEAHIQEDSAEIEIGQKVNYLIKKEPGEKGEEFKIYGSAFSRYKIISKNIKDLYRAGKISSWEARQELLRKNLASYNFYKENKKEEENLAIESLEEKLVEMCQKKLIDSSGADLIRESLGNEQN